MASPNVNSIASATQDQFLQLLIAQIQNQDPLNPVTDTEFVAQLAQFSSLQSLQTLNASFGQMLQLQQLSQGSDLIGKRVEYVPPGSTDVTTGTVDRLTVTNGTINLQIGNDAVGLDQLRTVLG
jgi:flagellar basal-body rod modification protein FlgD